MLTGKLLTGRDAAHKRLVDMMAKGEKLPVDLTNRFIYYTGPVDAVRDEAVGPAGPTTSSRMDKFVEPVLAQTGLIGMVGKSERGPVAIESIKKHGAVYCIAVGGAAYLVSNAIRGSKVLAFEDLGMEAIREFEVKDMPVTVAVDAAGNAVHKPAQQWRARIGRSRRCHLESRFDDQDAARRERVVGCALAGAGIRAPAPAHLAASAQTPNARARRSRGSIRRCACIGCRLGDAAPRPPLAPDHVSERLATLWQFAGGAFRCGHRPVTTALQRLPPALPRGTHAQLMARDKLDLKRCVRSSPSLVTPTCSR